MQSIASHDELGGVLFFRQLNNFLPALVILNLCPDILEKILLDAIAPVLIQASVGESDA